ncbi:MAG: tRNA 2-thiouridine(34) synthase MnmA [Anaerolineae bacterium]
METTYPPIHSESNETAKTDNAQTRVVVALSGGVDSAVAAGLLLREGLDVYGVTLRLWRDPALPPGDVVESATAVADALHIPLRVVDLRDRFYEQVVAAFVDAYARGETPNPCVTCNPTLKFAALLAEADRLGAHWIATGHYAIVRQPSEGPATLARAHCQARDQSYALYRLDQSVLSRLKLPLGEFTDKGHVRELARAWNLPVTTRPDSQDLCFMGGGDYRTLLQTLRPEALQPGPIYDEAGQRLGEHRGLPFYTVGQREGLRIAAGQPLYVLRLEPKRNALIVGPGERLLRDTCTLRAVTFTAGEPPSATFNAVAQLRYHAAPIPVKVKLLNNDRARVTFGIPRRGVTPGQSLVFYQDDNVLGGGFIEP